MSMDSRVGPTHSVRSAPQGYHLLIVLPSLEDHPARTLIIYSGKILIFLLGRAMMAGDSRERCTLSTVYASKSRQVYLLTYDSAFHTS